MSDRSNVIAINAKDYSKDIIDILEKALADAREGEIKSASIMLEGVDRQYSIYSYGNDRHTLAGMLLEMSHVALYGDQ